MPVYAHHWQVFFTSEQTTAALPSSLTNSSRCSLFISHHLTLTNHLAQSMESLRPPFYSPTRCYANIQMLAPFYSRHLTKCLRNRDSYLVEVKRFHGMKQQLWMKHIRAVFYEFMDLIAGLEYKKRCMPTWLIGDHLKFMEHAWFITQSSLSAYPRYLLRFTLVFTPVVRVLEWTSILLVDDG